MHFIGIMPTPVAGAASAVESAARWSILPPIPPPTRWSDDPPPRPSPTSLIPGINAGSRVTEAKREQSRHAIGKACSSWLPHQTNAKCLVSGDPLGIVSVAYDRGAFDASIRAAKAGRHRIRLLLDHKTDHEFCNTLDHPFYTVWTCELDVWCAVDGTTRWGAFVLRMLEEYPEHRQLSVGLVPDLTSATEVDGAWLYKAVHLEEISLVKVGGCPGTRLRII